MEVSRNQFYVFVTVGVLTVGQLMRQLHQLDDIGSTEPVFHMLKSLQKVTCSIWGVFVLKLS